MKAKTRLVVLFIALVFGMPSAVSTAAVITDSGFESGAFTGWNKGAQQGTLSNGVITGNGTGVTLINSAVTFSAPSHSAVGNQTLSNGSPNPYYAPAVEPATWTFSPYGQYAAALQPVGATTFDNATAALGLTSAENSAIKALLVQQQQASGLGNPAPTNAAWITRTVSLSAGTTYTMSWNYIGTDYVPFNDGSITSLVYQGSGSAPVITVNNGVSSYALLGFTNPGTGDYSTGTYGSTGWQQSTYQVSVSGDYTLGFAVFNLGDTSLSPVLLVDSQPGSTLKNGSQFGAVVPNNPNAPVVTTVPAVTTTTSTTTEPPASTTTTEPPAPTTTDAPTTTQVQEPSTAAPETTQVSATTAPSEPVLVTIPPSVDLPETGRNHSGVILIAVCSLVVGLIFTTRRRV